MTCDPCQRAEANPHTGHYGAACMNCQARAIAQGQEAHKRASDPGAVQEVMRRVWKREDEYRRGRSLVWEWIRKFEGAA